MSGHSIKLKPEETPLVILADGCFGEQRSKTGTGVIRYGKWPIAAVIDASKAGQSVRQATGLHCDAPIVAGLDDALSYHPKALLIGIAPPGGTLPDEWKAIVAQAIAHGLHIISGLHSFIADDPGLAALAHKHQVTLWDVRNPDCYEWGHLHPIVDQAARPTGTTVVTMVGSDCSVGKMVTALELHSGAESKGHTSEFVATGQTGILIAGKGVPLDRLIGDFMAGTIELAVKQAIEPRHPRWVFVEGQGSLIHPSYSGVTLGLLHGSLPDALILCHRADLKLVRGGYQVPIPPLGELVTLYETAAAWVCPPGKTHPKVVGLAVNTSMLSDDEAKAYLSEQSAILSLPATDPVRYGVAPLLDALEDAFPCR